MKTSERYSPTGANQKKYCNLYCEKAKIELIFLKESIWNPP